ncbi:hypothetical protein LSAT2_005961 [Lamellibrachia satsuma]|nr:hypothetical protein LSAT2_005961 [Lamellibrachia satsuma]
MHQYTTCCHAPVTTCCHAPVHHLLPCTSTPPAAMHQYTTCCHAPVHHLLPCTCTPPAAMHLYTTCCHAPVHHLLPCTSTPPAAMHQYTTCCHAPVHHLLPCTCTPPAAMHQYTTCCHAPVHHLLPCTCTPLAAMHQYTTCCHAPVHHLLPCTCTPLAAMHLYTTCSHAPVHHLLPCTSTQPAAMHQYTTCCHAPVHHLLPCTCTPPAAMHQYTTCSHAPVHHLLPCTCTPLAAMHLYTTCCRAPVTTCCHAPVHHLLPCTSNHLLPCTSTPPAAMHLYTTCCHAPVHHLLPCTSTPPAAMHLYTTCCHAPVHHLQPCTSNHLLPCTSTPPAAMHLYTTCCHAPVHHLLPCTCTPPAAMHQYTTCCHAPVHHLLPCTSTPPAAMHLYTTCFHAPVHHLLPCTCTPPAAMHLYTTCCHAPVHHLLPWLSRELHRNKLLIKFGNTTYKTDVYRKSLNPQWNSEWFRFEVDDEDLQDEPLQIRVLDHDTYSAHDAIGKVYIDLDPLLSKENTSVFSGWFPIYDTMHGIRGNLNIIVKVDLFTDFNKFRQSSCGVKFFCTSRVPEGHLVQAILGFVEELVVNDDPEYQWIDKIRSMRASNEARQVQFSKLSGQLQRKIGLKVLELGGNSVIGYQQYFDLEGESGIVVRAIGTAVKLTRLSQPLSSPPPASPGQDLSPSCGVVRSWSVTTHSGCLTAPLGCTPPVSPMSATVYRYPLTSRLSSHRASVPCVSMATASPSCHSPFVGSSFVLPEEGLAMNNSPTMVAVTNVTKPSSSPIKTTVTLLRRSSDSDIDVPPKGGSLSGSSGSGNAPIKPPLLRSVVPQQQSIEMLEYPFFTFDLFPPGFIVHLGGIVSARSVKLLDRIHNPGELVQHYA